MDGDGSQAGKQIAVSDIALANIGIANAVDEEAAGDGCVLVGNTGIEIA
jgi:hypothetical protein